MASAKPTAKPAAKPAAAKPAAKPAATPPAKPTAVATAPKTTAVAPRQGTGVIRGEDVPDYIKQNTTGRGSEKVEMGDMVIPRLELVQALSPCINKQKGEYIEGAEVGDIFNTVTRELFKAENGVVVCPVLFEKQYLVWKDRKKGGGFRGAYATIQEAQARIAGEADAADLEASETAQQYVYVIREDGTADEAVVSMNRTKLKISKQWNSLIRLNGGDRFSRIYQLFSVEETNSEGQDYKNFGVRTVGFPPQEVYERAEAMYEAISSGALKVAADVSQEGVDETAGGGKTEY